MLKHKSSKYQPSAISTSSHDEKDIIRTIVRGVEAEPQPATNGWRRFGWRPETKGTPGVSTDQAYADAMEHPRRRSSRGEAKAPVSKSDPRRNNDGPLSDRSTPVAVPRRRVSRQDPNVFPTTDVLYPENVSSRSARSGAQDRQPLPQSVASLLASTTIPKQRKPRSSQSSSYMRMSTQELMEEWRNDELNTSSSLSSSMNMDVLLSPPSQPMSLDPDGFDEAVEIPRAYSSDSVPSLTIDDSSEISVNTWSFPSTPLTAAQRRSKSKTHSLPRELDHSGDHPLSSVFSDDDIDEDIISTPPKDLPQRHPRTHPTPAEPRFQMRMGEKKPSAFKSNLTTSLTNLKNSIRSSFSNFSVPTLYTVPEDHLSRGLFSDRPFPYKSEMRPRPIEGPPSPELRRYFNPSSYHLPSPGQDLHLHGHGRKIEHIDDLHISETQAAFGTTSPSMVDEPAPTSPDRLDVIALLSFAPTRHSALPHDNPGKAGVPLAEAGRGITAPAGDQDPNQVTYQRELRENGEFLRICVMEMNMRRAGKLPHSELGRARLWLPPREGCFVSAKDELCSEKTKGNQVPSRWVGVVA